jgi:AraC-like DNA-binding protein
VVGRQLVDLIGLAVSEDPRTLTSGQSSVRMAHLTRIEALVRRRLSDPSLGVGAVAAEAGISPRYLHALFRDAGQPFGHWVRTQRLEAARAALADPGNRQSIAAIAYGCGFSDQAQFSRSFRDAYGCSPRDYRRMRPRGIPVQ